MEDRAKSTLTCGNLQLHNALPEAHDRAVNPAAGHYAVPGFQVGKQLLEFLALLRLRSQNQEIPDARRGGRRRKVTGQARPTVPGSAARRIGFTKRHSIKVEPCF